MNARSHTFGKLRESLLVNEVSRLKLVAVSRYPLKAGHRHTCTLLELITFRRPDWSNLEDWTNLHTYFGQFARVRQLALSRFKLVTLLNSPPELVEGGFIIMPFRVLLPKRLLL